MDAKQCDICKVFFPKPEANKSLVIYRDGVPVDVCDRCYEQLEKYVKGDYRIVQKAKVVVTEETRKLLSEKMKAFNAKKKLETEAKVAKELKKEDMWEAEENINLIDADYDVMEEV